jgi:hypothetical protein
LDALPGLGCLPKSTLTVLVKTMLLLLGVKPENYPNGSEKAVLGEYINGSLKNYSPLEIRKAFELAIQGKLKVEVYQKLDCILVGKVMSAYEKYKQIEIKREQTQDASRKREERENRIVSPNEKAQIERDFIESSVLPSYKNYKAAADWNVEQVHCHIYDLLDRRGLVELTNDVKYGLMKDAESILRQRIAEKRATNGRAFQLLTSAMDNDVRNIAKSLALRQVYFELQLSETNLIEVLK